MSIHSETNLEYYVIPEVDYQRIETTLAQSGGLIRIRGPQKFGKTSLLYYLLETFQQQGDRRVILDLQKVDSTLLTDSERFLRAFALYVTRSLGFASTLEDYWDPDLGAKLNCSFYFEEYILEMIEGDRLILVIENLDCLFAYHNTAREVLPLFRSWYEDARRTPIWSKLNLIVTYALEIYITLDVQQSPFNVGLPITLEGFTVPNILALAERYQLPWNLEIVEYLYHMLGRHPHLIRLTIEHFSCQKNLDITTQDWQSILTSYFKNSLHNDSIYRSYFSRWWHIIRRHTDLFDALAQLLNNPTAAVELPAMTAYNLEYLGLVSREGTTVTLRGELYQQYFQTQVAQLEQLLTNLDESSLQTAINHERLQQLEQENFELRSLAERDSLTNLYNRRSFDAIFAARWQAAQAEGQGFMLLLCDVDFFKQFNDTYGHDVGDEVLRKVAQVLLRANKDFSDCAARYGGEEFVLLRLVKDQSEAIALAERIRLDVEALNLSNLNNQNLSPPPKITISIGVVLCLPKFGQDKQELFKKADELLYKAKSNGRNQVCYYYDDLSAIAPPFN